MTDLSHEASAKYWYEFIDPTIYKVITFMESVEDWTLDGNAALEEAISELEKKFDDIDKVDLGLLNQEDKFIRLVGNIKTGRGLRLLQALDTAHPGSASRVLIHAEETSLGATDPAGFFLKRNIVFERLRLLSRVFSKQRLQMVLRALEGEE
jgi:intracellular multiplication protein IcmW